MKSKKTIIICVLLSIFLCLFVVDTSFAGSNQYPDDFLVKTGEHYLRKGDAKGAFHEFSKALMINPDNEKAREYLRMAGMRTGYYPGVVGYEEHYRELNHHIGDYREQILELETEKRKMRDKFVDLMQEKQSLYELNLVKSQKIYKLERRIDQQIEELQKRDYIIEHQETMDKMGIAEVEALVSQRNRFYKEEMIRQQGELESLKYELDKKEAKLNDMRERFTAVVKATRSEKDVIDRVSSEYGTLKEEAYLVNGRQERMINVMEDVMQFSEEHLDDARDSLVKKEVALARSQEARLAKLDEVIKMNDTLMQSVERVDNKDEMIDSQNSHILEMEKELQDARQKALDLEKETKGFIKIK